LSAAVVFFIWRRKRSETKDTIELSSHYEATLGGPFNDSTQDPATNYETIPKEELPKEISHYSSVHGTESSMGFVIAFHSIKEEKEIGT
jgi:hypothetical protein